MTDKLKGKVAIITGGNSGIGESTAELFASEGASVVIAARREDEGLKVRDSIRTSGGSAEFVRCDVTKPSDIKTVVAETIDIYKGIDILFNNAGVGGPEAFPEESREQWDYVLDVNLNGVYEMSSAVWPHMVERGGGAVINMSSGAAVTGFSPYILNASGRMPPASYFVAKAGVDAFTRWTASLGGEVNIRVNGVRPGQIITPLTDREGKGEHGLKKLFDIVQIARGPGYPIDVANAVLFLASEDSRFITGEIMNIDGGLAGKL